MQYNGATGVVDYTHQTVEGDEEEQKLVRVAVSIEHEGEVRQISVPQGSLEVVAADNDAGANGDESGEPGRGEPRRVEDRHTRDGSADGRQHGFQRGFDVDDAEQGFEEEAVGAARWGAEAIEQLVESTASEVARGSVEGSGSAGPTAQGQDQAVGGGRPRRQVALTWPPVDEVNRLTREHPQLFEVEEFDRHLRGRLYAHDFDSWVDLSETCGLQMADSRMKMLREIVEGNPREEPARVRPAAREQPGGRSSRGLRRGQHRQEHQKGIRMKGRRRRRARQYTFVQSVPCRWAAVGACRATYRHV